jgi:hypothetical protein
VGAKLGFVSWLNNEIRNKISEEKVETVNCLSTQHKVLR